MSDSYFDPNWQSKVTVPVRRVGKHWEFFYGGDVPVMDGALGELTLCASEITDHNFKSRVSREVTVRILGEGTELRIALSDRSQPHALLGHWPDPFPTAVPARTTRFEQVWLGPQLEVGRKSLFDEERKQGGLWLKLKGLERSELHGSTIRMPDGAAKQYAQSLNHAVTMLSEQYEQHRISHSGNVYTQVFYQEPDGRWYPLDDLRQGVIAGAERTLLKATWAEVEKQLGWRPAPPPAKKRRLR